MTQVFKLMLLGERSLYEYLTVLCVVFVLVWVSTILCLGLTTLLFGLFARIGDEVLFVVGLFGYIC
jgi:hypothetical protein